MKQLNRGNTLSRDQILAIAKLGFFLSLLYFFTGCGAKSTAVREFANTDLASSQINAECNSFSGDGVRLSGKIKVYTDNSGNTAEDIHQVKITDVANNFEADENYAIRFFRWKAIGTSTEIDSEPLEFRLEIDNGFGSYVPATGYMDYMTKKDLINVSNSYNLNETEVSAILRKVRVVVFGTDFSYQVLKITMYNGGSVVGDADVLLPVFAGHPDIYAKTHADVLNKLHPLYGYKDLTDADLQSHISGLCSGF